MQITSEENGLEFFDSKIKCFDGKLLAVVYRFIAIMPSVFYPVKNIKKVPQGTALGLWRFCDTTER